MYYITLCNNWQQKNQLLFSEVDLRLVVKEKYLPLTEENVVGDFFRFPRTKRQPPRLSCLWSLAYFVFPQESSEIETHLI